MYKVTLIKHDYCHDINKPYLNTTFLQMKFGDVAYNSSSRSVLKN